MGEVDVLRGRAARASAWDVGCSAFVCRPVELVYSFEPVLAAGAVLEVGIVWGSLVGGLVYAVEAAGEV